MEYTDREMLELCKAWFEDIMERSERLTSGNVSHGSRAIHGTAKNYAEYVEEYLGKRMNPNDEQIAALTKVLDLFVKEHSINRENAHLYRVLSGLIDLLRKIKD